jgi:hypothetical protein
MTTPDFNDLTPPEDLIWSAAKGVETHWKVACVAARWGARHGYEQARQLWPEPITDRPPTEGDADSFEDVQVLTSANRWKVAHWSSAQTIPWLHTPRWQPRPPSLQEQALALLPYDPQAGTVTLNSVEVLKIRRALEQAGEGVE